MRLCSHGVAWGLLGFCRVEKEELCTGPFTFSREVVDADRFGV